MNNNNDETTTMPTMVLGTRSTCQECGRVFDLMNDVDAEEWHYGHDCEG